jgi:selenide,water dikinase
MAAASHVTIQIDSTALPIIDGVLEMVSQNASGGMNTNKQHFLPGIEFGREIPDARRDLLFDPQTSGGLLISVAANSAETAFASLQKAGISASFIGSVTASTGPRLIVG